MTDPAMAPLGPDDARLAPTWRAAYSDRTALLMVRFAQYAYARPEAINTMIAPGGFGRIAALTADDIQVFLADGPEMAILSFRGTADLADWGYDLDARLIPMPGRDGIAVHAGFWQAYGDIAAWCRARVNALPPDLGLYITGHSLGGALAQLAAADLERDTLAACYTFGSPRVATKAFDALVKCPHYRLVDNWDLVPGVPPPLAGFRHTGDPRLLKGAAPTVALRRDRNLWARIAIDLWTFVEGLFDRDVTSVDDHMIWNYRGRLETIAAARNGRAQATTGGSVSATKNGGAP